MPTLFSADAYNDIINLTFRESLNRNIQRGLFEVKVNGSIRRILEENVQVNSDPYLPVSTISLRLERPITYGDEITISYRDPSRGNDHYVVQDNQGNDLGSFTDWHVRNNSRDDEPVGVSSLVVAHNIATLYFTETIRALSPNDISNLYRRFTFSTPRTSTQPSRTISYNRFIASADNRSLVFELQRAIGQHEQLILQYDPDSLGTQIRDQSNNSLLPFEQTAFNADVTAPVIESATANGNRITLQISEEIDRNAIITVNRFGVKINNVNRGIQRITSQTEPQSDGSKRSIVSLDLASVRPAINNGDSVVVSYSDPTNNNDLSGVIQDSLGNDARSTTVNAINTTPAVDREAPQLITNDCFLAQDYILLRFNEPIRADSATSNKFHINVSNASGIDIGTINVTSLSTLPGDATSLRLGLSSAINYNADINTQQREPLGPHHIVKLTYTDNDDLAANDQSGVVEDISGNDIQNINRFTINNSIPDLIAPVITGGLANNDWIELTASEPLAPLDTRYGYDNYNRPSHFRIRENTREFTPHATIVDNNKIYLGLPRSLTANSAVTVSLNQNEARIKDRSNNAIRGFQGLGIQNQTQNSSLATISASNNGNLVLLRIDSIYGPFGSATPDPWNFDVRINGSTRSISHLRRIQTGNNTGLFELLIGGDAIRFNDTVELDYKDYTSRNDHDNVLEDNSGRDILSINNLVVQNQTTSNQGPILITGNGIVTNRATGHSILSLRFDRQLSTIGVSPNRFLINVDGVIKPVSNVDTTGTNLRLYFSENINPQSTITIQYQDISTANESSDVIQDEQGRDADSFADWIYTPDDYRAPTLLGDSYVDGNRVVLRFDEPLSKLHTPTRENYGVVRISNSGNSRSELNQVVAINAGSQPNELNLQLAQQVQDEDYSLNLIANAEGYDPRTGIADNHGNKWNTFSRIFPILNRTGDFAPPVPQRAYASNRSVYLVMGSKIDIRKHSNQNFRLKVNDIDRTFNIALNYVFGTDPFSETVELTLSEYHQIQPGDQIRLEYIDPNPRQNDTTNVLEDREGRDAAAFTISVTNRSADTVAPTITQAILLPPIAGTPLRHLDLTFSEPIKSSEFDPKDLFIIERSITARRGSQVLGNTTDTLPIYSTMWDLYRTKLTLVTAADVDPNHRLVLKLKQLPEEYVGSRPYAPPAIEDEAGNRLFLRSKDITNTEVDRLSPSIISLVASNILNQTAGTQRSQQNVGVIDVVFSEPVLRQQYILSHGFECFLNGSLLPTPLEFSATTHYSGYDIENSNSATTTPLVTAIRLKRADQQPFLETDTIRIRYQKSSLIEHQYMDLSGNTLGTFEKLINIPPTVSIRHSNTSNLTATIQESGTTAQTQATLTFSRSGYGIDRPLTINYRISGNASIDRDITGLTRNLFNTSTLINTGKISFAAGSATASMTLSAINDNISELDESIVISILPSTGYRVAQDAILNPTTATVVIKDDDHLRPQSIAAARKVGTLVQGHTGVNSDNRILDFSDWQTELLLGTSQALALI